MDDKSKKPKIRFAGFNDEWEYCKLDDTSVAFEYGLNASATIFDGKNKYIRITDIDDDSRLFIKKDLTSPNMILNNSDRFVLKKGDILFARTGASVGKTYIYNESDGLVYFAGFLIRARIKSEFDARFIFLNTLTHNYNKFIYATSQRSGQPGVNAQEYGEFSFNAPKDTEEQQKIGSLFSNIDNLINQKQKKYDKLVNIKKSMLEKMFPQNNSKYPEVRFEGFNDEWEKCKIEVLGSIVTGSTPLTSDNDNYGGEYLFVSPADIQGNRYIDDTITKLSKKGFGLSRELKKGAILFVSIGSTIGKVAQAKSSVATNQQINAIEVNENFNCDYVYSLMENKSQEIKAMASTQAVPIVNKTSFSNVDIIITKNLEEQQKIGEYFQNLDKLINQQQKQLEKLKTIKKSLLENMFV